MMKREHLLRRLFIAGNCFWAAQALAEEPVAVATFDTTSVSLSGEALGGVLTLVHTPHRTADYVSIDTTAGEPAESVIARLATMFNQAYPFGWYGDDFAPGAGWIRANRTTLENMPGAGKLEYIFAGTETGLGIPPPPRSLSGRFDLGDVDDRSDDELVLHWANPPGGYDWVGITIGGPFYYRRRLDGTATRHIVSRDQVRDVWSLGIADVCVIGVRGDVPSNAAAMTLRPEKNTQEELVDIPFTAGVAPNWTAWSATAQGGGVNCEQAEKWVDPAVSDVWKPRTMDRIVYRQIKWAKDKRLFQVIKTSSGGGTGGIWRQFLGLIPGHRYRISARLNTLVTDPGGNWSFSFHAAHNGPNGADLTNAQMSGTAALPDGSSGPTAGQIAVYGPQTTTNGKWLLRSTSRSGSDDNRTGDITLPPDVDTITVWLRLSGSNARAGMDWIKVEDVSPPQRR